MFEKIVLISSLLGIIGGSSFNEIKPYYNDVPNSNSNVVHTQCFYAKSSVTQDLIKLHSFNFGFIGKEELQNVNFTFSLLSSAYSYYCKFIYKTVDGGNSGYEEKFEKGNYGLQNGLLTIKRSELPLSSRVNFELYLAAYKNYEEIVSSNSRPVSYFKMSFVLDNRGSLVKANSSLFVKSIYFFEYDEKKIEYLLYYDELELDEFSYEEIAYPEIYFRIKPKKFIFYTRNVFNSTEGKIYVLNNNGSFNDCTEKDTYGRYFPMIVNDLGDNMFNFSYKNINRGGKNNLYLDPLNMHMYKEKKNKYYEVENIYLPIKHNEVYEEIITLMPVLTNFGSNYVNVGIPFSIYFEGDYYDDFYFAIGRVGEIGNDSSGEEIIP